MSHDLPPRVQAVLDRVYRILLITYPSEHRREYGPLMAQAFGDLCHDAYRQRGASGLVRLCGRVLWDLVTTASVEHLDALRIGGGTKMENRKCTPVSWVKVGLAILPGLFIVGTRSGLFRRVFGLENWLTRGQHDLIPVYITLGIVVAGLIVERRPAVWSFPTLGLLLFSAPGWLFTLFARFGDPRSPFWQVAPPYLMLAALAAIAALAVYRVFKQHSLHIPRSGWVLLGLMILTSVAYAIVEAVTARGSNEWTDMLSLIPLQLWWMGLILLPVAIGLPLARRDGLLAGLVLVASQFVLVDEIFDPTYSVGFWAHWEPSAILDQAKIVLSYLPALLFLVITPIWMLRSRSTSGRVLGLILPPFIALIGTDVIESVALRGTLAEYSINLWLTHSVSTAQFLMALALAAVMYHWIERQGPAADTQESREALSGKATTATASNAA